MASVTDAITYYLQFEPLYNHGQSGAVEHLRSTMTDVYSDILRFLAQTKAYYVAKKSKKVGP